MLDAKLQSSAVVPRTAEVRYRRSNRSGFLPRAAHALTANFVTYDKNGRRAPHISRVGSAFAAEFTGNLWMPAGYRDTSSALRGVGIELGVSSAFNLISQETTSKQSSGTTSPDRSSGCG